MFSSAFIIARFSSTFIPISASGFFELHPAASNKADIPRADAQSLRSTRTSFSPDTSRQTCRGPNLFNADRSTRFGPAVGVRSAGAAAINDFEFLTALFVLLFALIVAEIALKFADAIDLHSERPMGVLNSGARLFRTDVTSFWLFIWSARNVLTVSWHSVYSGVLLAILYLVAASLLFPRDKRAWAHLDDHYWRRKRFVAGAMLIVNLLATAAMMTRATPAWNDWCRRKCTARRREGGHQSPSMTSATL